MKKLFIALILVVLIAPQALAQLATAPEGAIIPNGALHYVVPSGIPIVALGGHLPYPSNLPSASLFPFSYPMVPVPVPPPSGSTSDRIRPPSASDNRAAFLPENVETNKMGMAINGHPGVISFDRRMQSSQ
jgi:hypothetical protein